MSDIQILLYYLRKYIDTHNISETYLESDKEDRKMIDKIQQIAEKHGFKF
jgi:hypothetical protein